MLPWNASPVTLAREPPGKEFSSLNVCARFQECGDHLKILVI
jgi:hypothetical protein